MYIIYLYTYTYDVYIFEHAQKYSQIYTSTLNNGFLERLLEGFPFKIFTKRNTNNTEKYI